MAFSILVDRVKELLQDFMSKKLGTNNNMPSKGNFSFAESAAELADDLIESLVIDVAVDLDFEFGLEISPMFDTSMGLPDPFIQINDFNLDGALGINDWTSTIQLGDVGFSVAGAKALLNVSSTISPSSIRISSPSDFVALVNPPTQDSDQIIFQASLDVVFPIFLIYQGVGVGSKIEYM